MEVIDLKHFVVKSFFNSGSMVDTIHMAKLHSSFLFLALFFLTSEVNELWNHSAPRMPALGKPGNFLSCSPLYSHSCFIKYTIDISGQ